MSFANLKRNRNSISSLIQAASATDKPEAKSYVDERQWKPTVDKAGNGYAVIRFLPASEGNELPWVRYWDHGFKGPTGQWYIERSLTSIGKQDPVSESNSKLWNSGSDDDKNVARDRKRRLHYVSNIYVESDPGNPENEGKVFLFTYGKKIFDKIMDVMQPQFADEAPVNPFDFWEGASFKLKIRNVEGYRNYDKSEFASQSKFLDGDEETLEKVYNKVYDLSEFVDPKNYKTYEELAARLALVLGESAPRTVREQLSVETTQEPPARKTAPAPSMKQAAADDEDEDDTMSFFAKLAAEE
jgi:hypothetical protein